MASSPTPTRHEPGSSPYERLLKAPPRPNMAGIKRRGDRSPSPLDLDEVAPPPGLRRRLNLLGPQPSHAGIERGPYGEAVVAAVVGIRERVIFAPVPLLPPAAFPPVPLAVGRPLPEEVVARVPGHLAPRWTPPLMAGFIKPDPSASPTHMPPTTAAATSLVGRVDRAPLPSPTAQDIAVRLGGLVKDPRYLPGAAAIETAKSPPSVPLVPTWLATEPVLDPDSYPDAQRTDVGPEDLAAPAAGGAGASYTETEVIPPSSSPEAASRTRTQDMHYALAAREVKLSSAASFNEDRSVLHYNGVNYAILSGKTTNFEGALASVGAAAFFREIILFNPLASPELEAAYRRFVESQSLTNEPVEDSTTFLSSFARFVQKDVFKEACSGSELESLIRNWMKEHAEAKHYLETSSSSAGKVPLISLDEFIKIQKGVCRHKALTACCLLSKLVKDFPSLLPEGRVIHVRETLPPREDRAEIGHTWVWYQTSTGTIFSIDAQFGKVLDLSDKEQYASACELYSKEVMDRLMSRFSKDKS